MARDVETTALLAQEEEDEETFAFSADRVQRRASSLLAALGLCCVSAVAIRSAGSAGKFSTASPSVTGWQTRLAAIREHTIGEAEVFNDALKSGPRLLGRSETASGVFETWHFTLPFDSHTSYVRRFGVDLPKECVGGKRCPLVVDFHGSYDSMFSQRAWTEWYKYLASAENKFVLLTPEGSPDAVLKPGAILNDCNTTASNCTSSSATSWNVLGWGRTIEPVSETETCDSADNGPGPDPICFWTTLKRNKTYPCFGTQLDKDPTACRLANHGNMREIPALCQSASGANDAEYFKRVLEFVVPHYGVDARAIYLTGQSMGGVAALQWAVQSGEYDLGPYRPAAIVPCSAGAARSAYANLDAAVPALLMWGYEDEVTPPTLWSGYTRGNEYLPYSTVFNSQLLSGADSAQLTSKALNVTGNKLPTRDCDYSCSESGSKEHRKMCCLMLWANALTGGKLLSGSHAQAHLRTTHQLGCADSMGEATSLDSSAFMVEGVLTTLRGVVGDASFDMSSLKFSRPDVALVPESFQKTNDMLCADVTNKLDQDIRVCIYQGAHTYPWKSTWSNDWIEGGAQVFHDFVWKGFLK